MVIIALDFENKEKALDFLKKFEGEKLFVKVGMELFYGEGPGIIEDIKKLGHKIFLDLKLHDIPNTVKKAMLNLAKLDVDIVNCHAKGGSKMMSDIMEELNKLPKRPKVIAVTELTSTDQQMLNEELQVKGEVIDSVVNLALLAKKSGLDGVVCSPLEVKKIKEVCQDDFLTVTPGIRPQNTIDDQARVTTPKMARELGCDFIVVGRPITKSADPVEAYKQIRKDFLGE